MMKIRGLTISAKSMRWFTSSGIIPVALEVNESPTAIMLIAKDYPRLFRGISPGSKLFAHPDDYKIDSDPITPEIFLYKPDARARLFLRTSFKLSESTYTSATFLIDTGCCSNFNICNDLKSVLKPRIKKGDSGNYIETIVNGNKGFLTVDYDLPNIHQPANVIGLPMFFYLGISFNCARIGSFQFDDEEIARNVCTMAKFDYL